MGWWATQSRRLTNLDAYLQMAPTPCKDAIEAVRAALKDPDYKVRFKAMREIYCWNGATLLLHIAILKPMFKDPDAEIRYMALNSLSCSLKPAELAEHAAEFANFMLSDSSARVRTGAITLLGKLDNNELLKYADDLFLAFDWNSYSSDERKNLIVVLAKLGPQWNYYTESILDLLVISDEQISVDEDHQVIQAGVKAIAKWGVSQLVIDHLQDPHWRVRKAMLQVVKWWGLQIRYLPAVARMTRDVHPQVRQSAKALLQKHHRGHVKVGSALWHYIRVAFRARTGAQKWLALTYAPGKPGHTRSMREFQDMFAK